MFLFWGVSASLVLSSVLMDRGFGHEKQDGPEHNVPSSKYTHSNATPYNWRKKCDREDVKQGSEEGWLSIEADGNTHVCKKASLRPVSFSRSRDVSVEISRFMYKKHRRKPVDASCNSDPPACPGPGPRVLKNVAVYQRPDEEATAERYLEEHEDEPALVDEEHVGDQGWDRSVACSCGKPGQDTRCEETGKRLGFVRPDIEDHEEEDGHQVDRPPADFSY